jgi:parallel beta-helix repeat protein
MRRAASVMTALAVVLGVLATGPTDALATDGDLEISVDTTLSEDHNGSIFIKADNVTLDCAGHLVSGEGLDPSASGIFLQSRTGVTVQNCVVDDFNSGFVVDFSSANSLVDNTVTNVRQGFTLSGSTDNRLEGNEVTGAYDYFAYGIISGSHRTTLIENTARSGAVGFLIEGTNDHIIERNMSVDTGGNGFDIKNSDGSTLQGNHAVGAANGFIVWVGSDDNTLTDNQAEGNAVGFTVAQAAAANLFEGNTASSNVAQGFLIETGASEGNSFTNNLAGWNGSYGFEDRSSGSGDFGTRSLYSSNGCPGNTAGPSTPGGLCDPSGSFSDDDGNTFEADIEWLAAEGITKGCNPPTNDLFCPDDSVTRGQMAAFLVRALDYTDDGGGDLFTDDDGNTFEADIDKLGTAGVTKGCNPPTNDRYCPNDYVTRGQMAAFLRRALDN